MILQNTASNRSSNVLIKDEILCPICKEKVTENLGEHIKRVHGKEKYEKSILKFKEKGISDKEIGEKFGINLRKLEKIITEKYGINISVLKKPKKIKDWQPKDFRNENKTVWSFKQRGNWATHDGRYRGNWSPYIPRNVIIRYSKPGEKVLDYFVGGGTTAVEAKLLGRQCIAMDINPAAIELTRENLKFEVPEFLLGEYPVYEPEISVGDARDLSNIPKESIDLICSHPPYAGIISYSSKIKGDLSALSIEDFHKEMSKVANESYRVLKQGGKCAVLIGDTRKQKHVIPIGFQMINVFLNTGFMLKELVIKRQHNCKTTGFWHEKSIKYNFLLLAHEYLPIFEKTSLSDNHSTIGEEIKGYSNIALTKEKTLVKKLSDLETTTVWIFPERDFEKRINRNVIKRYSNGNGYLTLTFTNHSESEISSNRENNKKIGLLFIKAPFLNNNPSLSDIQSYLKELKTVVQRKLPLINKDGFLTIQTKDVRINGYIEPVAKRVVDLLVTKKIWLKEIVVSTNESKDMMNEKKENLKITHKYLLVYEVKK